MKKSVSTSRFDQNCNKRRAALRVIVERGAAQREETSKTKAGPEASGLRHEPTVQAEQSVDPI